MGIKTVLLFAAFVAPSFLVTHAQTLESADQQINASDVDGELQGDPNVSPSPNNLPSSADYDTPMSVVPVHRVVMYNTGVIHIQHFGDVDGRGTMSVEFQPEDVDDVLKSLVFFDSANGQIHAVRYQPAPTTLDRTVSEFEGPMTLAQLLQLHRGEEIEIETADPVRKITGIIWGVENRPDGERLIETVVLVIDEKWQSIPLDKMQSFRFSNEHVQQKLRNALAGIAAQRTTDQNATVKFLLDGEGKRNMGFAYVVDGAVWRSTYRLELDGDQASLQAWAHVDNVSGRDWEAIQLELRSGRPEVFHVELFSPWLSVRRSVSQSVFDLPPSLDLIRPFIAPLGNRADGSLGYSGKFGGGGFGFGGGGFGGAGGMAGPAYQLGEGSDDDREDWQTRLLRSASAIQGRASQMVQYRVERPVSLRSGESAALPVLNENLPFELFTLFDLVGTDDEEDEEDEPSTQSFANGIRTVELENSSSFALTGGPVSVFDSGDFVGDSALGKLEVGEKAKIGFALDRAVSVSLEVQPLISSPVQYQWQGEKLLLTYGKHLQRQLTVVNKDVESRKVRILLPVAEQEYWADFKIAPMDAQLDGATATLNVEVEAQSEFEMGTTSTGRSQSIKRLVDFNTVQLQEILSDKGVFLDDVTRDRLKAYVDLKVLLTENDLKETAVKQKLTSAQARVRSLQATISTLKVDVDAAEPFVQELIIAAKEEAELQKELVAAKLESQNAQHQMEELMEQK